MALPLHMVQSVPGPPGVAVALPLRYLVRQQLPMAHLAPQVGPSAQNSLGLGFFSTQVPGDHTSKVPQTQDPHQETPRQRVLIHGSVRGGGEVGGVENNLNEWIMLPSDRKDKRDVGISVSEDGLRKQSFGAP